MRQRLAAFSRWASKSKLRRSAAVHSSDSPRSHRRVCVPEGFRLATLLLGPRDLLRAMAGVLVRGYALGRIYPAAH
jgi:hypothetical protein